MTVEEAGPSKERGAEGASRYSSIGKPDLERLAIAAICEHRALLAADQAVYEEWLRAANDPTISGAVVQTLKDEYLARQTKSGGQQQELSDILDALGYVPDVGFSADDQESDEAPILCNRDEMGN